MRRIAAKCPAQRTAGEAVLMQVLANLQSVSPRMAAVITDLEDRISRFVGTVDPTLAAGRAFAAQPVPGRGDLPAVHTAWQERRQALYTRERMLVNGYNAIDLAAQELHKLVQAVTPAMRDAVRTHSAIVARDDKTKTTTPEHVLRRAERVATKARTALDAYRAATKHWKPIPWLSLGDVQRVADQGRTAAGRYFRRAWNSFRPAGDEPHEFDAVGLLGAPGARLRQRRSTTTGEKRHGRRSPGAALKKRRHRRG